MDWQRAYEHLKGKGYSPFDAAEAIDQASEEGRHAVTGPDRLGASWLVCKSRAIDGMPSTGIYVAEE